MEDKFKLKYKLTEEQRVFLQSIQIARERGFSHSSRYTIHVMLSKGMYCDFDKSVMNDSLIPAWLEWKKDKTLTYDI